jgi:hypothetical protein
MGSDFALMGDVGNQNGGHGDNRADNVDESGDIRTREREREGTEEGGDVC